MFLSHIHQEFYSVWLDELFGHVTGATEGKILGHANVKVNLDRYCGPVFHTKHVSVNRRTIGKNIY